MGRSCCRNIPRLNTVAKIVLYQNKNYDGSGFPIDSVAGEDIPIGSRILKVLSDLLQLETKETPKAIALSLMQNRTGLYDPRVLDAAFACFDIYLPEATSAKSSGRPIGFKELQPGHVSSQYRNVRRHDDRDGRKQNLAAAAAKAEKFRRHQRHQRARLRGSMTASRIQETCGRG